MGPNSLDNNREKEVFFEAVTIDDLREREEFLREHCGENTPLRQAVDELLTFHSEDSFLEKPASKELSHSARTRAAHDHQSTRLEIGTVIDDRYQLVECLGEGGCGVVYRAEQQHPVRREVALKVIKLGMDTLSVISRFEAERQALAIMDHPAIARVFDGGTTESGRAYFVMELVRGTRITDFAREHALPIEARLRLFIQVCQAIEHAHQKGIIHRDVKPSNILVTQVEGEARPKVIDFGIAKAVRQPQNGETALTELNIFLGTPAYTSPEQSRMDHERIDTRTDVYSLGATLYELLTGSPPFDLTQISTANLIQIQQTIADQIPTRPSLHREALRPKNSPGGDTSNIPDDLDWITMKCLEKDVDRRYASVLEVEKDLQRYLNGEPVLAHPPSALYRFHRFYRRNRVAVLSSAAMLIMLFLATGISTTMAVRAIRAEREQNHQRTLAEAAQKIAEAQRLEALEHSYDSDMNLVQSALKSNNRGRARDLLNRHHPANETSLGFSAPDLRNWEWWHFRHITTSAASFELPQQPARIRSLAINPSDNLLASIDDHRRLRLWDLSAPSPESLPLETHDEVLQSAFSADGRWLATAQGRGFRRTLLSVSSLSGSTRPFEIEIPGGSIALAFSEEHPDTIMSVNSSTITRWPFTSPSANEVPLARLSEGRGNERFRWWRTSVATFSNDRSLVAVGQGGEVFIYRCSDGSLLRKIPALDDSIASLAFSPHEQVLAVGPSFTEPDSDVRLFNSQSGNELGRLHGHTAWVSGIAFGTDGGQLISSAADQTIRIWDPHTLQASRILRGHRSEVNCLVLSNAGDLMVSGGKDGSLLGWNLTHSQNPAPVETLEETVRQLAFIPQRELLLSLDIHGKLLLRRLSDLTVLEQFSNLEERYTHALPTPAGDGIVGTTHDRKVHLIDIASGKTLHALTPPADDRNVGNVLGFLGGTDDLLTMNRSGQIRRWDSDLTDSRPVATINSRQRAILSPNAPLLALDQGPNQLTLLNLETNESTPLINGADRQTGEIAFARDGKTLAVGSIDGSVDLWDIDTATLRATLRSHLLGVHGIAFSSDGSRLASASANPEAIKIWNLKTLREVATLSGTGTIFQQVSFSSDGSALAAVSLEGTAHLWRAPREVD